MSFPPVDSLPLATLFYLALYITTLIGHIFFMSYVLAGSCVLAGAVLRGDPHSRSLEISNKGAAFSSTASSVCLILRDWLPAILSGAITAGIAPLLFIQILYQQEFYTANLLLFNRWMAILPILILGFYTLYLLKTKVISKLPTLISYLVGVTPLLCFLFTGYAWSENHLLSLESEAFWGDFYSKGKLFYYSESLVYRFLIWFCGAFPLMALAVRWQRWWTKQEISNPTSYAQDRFDEQLLRATATLGIVLLIACQFLYFYSLAAPIRELFTSTPCLLLMGAVLVGAAIQLLSWWARELKGVTSLHRLILNTLGAVITVSSLVILREMQRIATLHSLGRWTRLTHAHISSMQVEGFGIFILCFLLTTTLSIGCIWVARERRA